LLANYCALEHRTPTQKLTSLSFILIAVYLGKRLEAENLILRQSLVVLLDRRRFTREIEFRADA